MDIDHAVLFLVASSVYSSACMSMPSIVFTHDGKSVSYDSCFGFASAVRIEEADGDRGMVCGRTISGHSSTTTEWSRPSDFSLYHTLGALFIVDILPSLGVNRFAYTTLAC